uniref:CCHC-type domain-containing protein n=1 Tax=Setaria italica TaxID=4555 RepID=K3ZZV1_SETIT
MAPRSVPLPPLGAPPPPSTSLTLSPTLGTMATQIPSSPAPEEHRPCLAPRATPCATAETCSSPALSSLLSRLRRPRVPPRLAPRIILYPETRRSHVAVGTLDLDGWVKAESRRARQARRQHEAPPRRAVPADLRGRCFNCFSLKHRAADCRSRPRCFGRKRRRCARRPRARRSTETPDGGSEEGNEGFSQAIPSEDDPNLIAEDRPLKPRHILDCSASIARREDDLAHGLVVTMIGGHEVGAVELVRTTIANRFEIEEERLILRPWGLVSFLLILPTDAMLERVYNGRRPIITPSARLHLKAWCSNSDCFPTEMDLEIVEPPLVAEHQPGMRTLKYPISIVVSQTGSSNSEDDPPSPPPADDNGRRHRRRRRHRSPSIPPEQAAPGGVSSSTQGRRAPVQDRLGPHTQLRLAYPHQEESASEPPIDAVLAGPTVREAHEVPSSVTEAAAVEAEAGMIADINRCLMPQASEACMPVLSHEEREGVAPPLYEALGTHLSLAADGPLISTDGPAPLLDESVPGPLASPIEALAPELTPCLQRRWPRLPLSHCCRRPCLKKNGGERDLNGSGLATEPVSPATEFINSLSQTSGALLPIPHINKRRKKLLQPPTEAPHRSRRLVKRVMQALDLEVDDEKEQFDQRILDECAKCFQQPQATPHTRALAALFGWSPPEDDTAFGVVKCMV